VARVRTNKGKVAEEYSSRAKKYNVASMVTRREGERKLRTLIRKGDVVVDLACGPGFALPLALGFAGEGGIVVAVDISLVMLKEARRSVENWEFPTRKLTTRHSHVRGLDRGKPRGARSFFVYGDGERLPIKEAVVNVTFSFAALHRMDPGRGMKEMFRVIAPGGYLLAEIPGAHDVDAMVFQHIPPAFLPRKVPKGFPPDFKLDAEERAKEQDRWRKFKAFCEARLPWLSAAISRGWVNGYEDLKSKYNEYLQGELDKDGLEAFVGDWERRNDSGELEWICFPTRRFFSEMVGELGDRGAMVVECSTSSFDPNVLRLGRKAERYFEFYTYTYSQLVRAHVAVLSKPLWRT
jgi:ubiquinone/menaquinone biosynthesis C-methylase UbiE